MILTKFNEHVSGAVTVYIQFPYNLTKRSHGGQWENQLCSVPCNIRRGINLKCQSIRT